MVVATKKETAEATRKRKFILVFVILLITVYVNVSVLNNSYDDVLISITPNYDAAITVPSTNSSDIGGGVTSTDSSTDNNTFAVSVQSDKNSETNNNDAVLTSNHLSSRKLIQPGEHYYLPGSETFIGPDGKPGYIHDPTFLVNNPPSFHIPDDQKDYVCAQPGKGVELPTGAPVLKAIRNHIETSTASRDVSLFCAIYTHTPRSDRTDTISETWGKKCDGLLYASDISNATTGHMHLPSNSKR